MALTKVEKEQVITDVSQLLSNSKMTVITRYQGTTVKALQTLRRQARDNGTLVRVAKNRLVIQAIKQSERFKNIDTAPLEGMLMYAFNNDDEVAPAQVIDKFAKDNPSLEFVGALTADGKFLDATEVKALAKLPSKAQLIAEVVATLTAPLNDVTNALSGNIHGLLDAIGAKAS